MLRVKDEKISIVLYKSGKMVHNGSDESEGVVDAVLEREDLYDYILGSDETGKGNGMVLWLWLQQPCPLKMN